MHVLIPRTMFLHVLIRLTLIVTLLVGLKKGLRSSKKSLIIFKEGSKESFYFAILYSVFFKLDETKDTFLEDKEVLEGVLNLEFLRCLEDKREGPYLDLNLNTFQRPCKEINDLLIEKKLFLRVYELRKKFRYLIKKGRQKNEVQRDLSASIEAQYNGFEIYFL